MDTRPTVDNFLHHGKVLFHLLQTETENLTDLDVQLLTATYLEQLRSGD
jgi:hypothetical protein